MSKISPCLWFNGEAEEAAKFYVSLLPDSRIEQVQKNTSDGPAGKAGSVLVVNCRYFSCVISIALMVSENAKQDAVRSSLNASFLTAPIA